MTQVIAGVLMICHTSSSPTQAGADRPGERGVDSLNIFNISIEFYL